MIFSAKSRRKLQIRCFRFLEHPKATVHIVYHLAIFSYVLLTLCLSALLNMDSASYANPAEANAISQPPRTLERVLFAMEITLATYFGLELCLRIWAAGCKARFQGVKGRVVFLSKFICIVDMLILGATLLLLIFGGKDGRFIGGSTVQNLRFLQILRMLHVDRGATSWKLMQAVLKMHKTELFAAYYLVFLGLMVMSGFVYVTEMYHDDLDGKDLDSEDRTFHSFGDAIWWGIITIMSVGYGDIVPHFWASKLITVIFALICVSLFTLVSSVIGVGLSLMVQDNQRRKQQHKQAPHAARVIQNYYRMRLLTTKYGDINFYKHNLTQKLIADELRTQLCKHLGEEHPLMRGGLHANLNFHGMLDAVKKIGHGFHIGRHHHGKDGSGSPRPRHGSGEKGHKRTSTSSHSSGRTTPNLPHTSSEPFFQHHPLEHKNPSFTGLPTGGDSAYNSAENSPGPAHLSDVEGGVSYRLPGSETTVHFYHQDNMEPHHSLASSNNFMLDLDSSSELPKRYHLALIAVWKFKFLAAKNRFRRARQPYDITDISEEVTENEHAQLSKLRDVQLHVDHVIGRPQLSLLTKNQQKLGLVQRLLLVEQKMAQLDKKADLVLQLATQIGEQVIMQRQEQKKLLMLKEEKFCVECVCRKIRMGSDSFD